MKRISRNRSFVVLALLGLGLMGVTLGTTCAGGGNNEPPLDPGVPVGNRPPRIEITSVQTVTNDMFAEQGEDVTISFTGDDGEDQSTVRVFASRSQTPSGADQIPIASGILIGPGSGSDTVVWDTTGVAVGTYFIFAEINDGVNPAVRVTSNGSVQVAPPGSRPQNDPPFIQFLTPLSNLGLSSQDELQLIYFYTDTDNAPTVTLLLDKDQDPTNDDINNPGDPLDPNSKIIILPSEPRRTTDPTFDGDPPPPDNPNNPPGQPDSLEVRRNPRTLGQTAPGFVEVKVYAFTIDFSRIPVRSDPYFIRATISDPTHTVHAYAVGSLTITSLAAGVVDINKVGFSVAGGRFVGFSTQENLGSDFVSVRDIDGDAVDEFMIGSRYGSPRNRFQAGSAYLIFGRRKIPFPLDTNNNGRPDVIDGNGNVVDFPAPPNFVENPYTADNVGRFGGVHSINSVSSFFRGTTYGMPEPHLNTLPPQALRDPLHPNIFTGGLTSITRIDMNNDGTDDLVFGLPFISGAWDYVDDDPDDGGCMAGAYGDGLPNQNHCTGPGPCGTGPADDMFSPRHFADTINEGMVIVVDGRTNIATTFRLFTDAAMAGQKQKGACGNIDDEGIGHDNATTPNGMRFRGGWLSSATSADSTDFPAVPIITDNQFGRTVAGVPSLDNDLGDDLLISLPGWAGGQGQVQIWTSDDYFGATIGAAPVGDWTNGSVKSMPSYNADGDCFGNFCTRGFGGPDRFSPVFLRVNGAMNGDNFGFARAAGQINQDGVGDIAAGAPGADRPRVVPGQAPGPALSDNGIMYILFTPAGGFGNTDLATENPPRVEVIGDHAGDRFGEVQTSIRDVDGDGIDDLAFASERYNDDTLGNAQAGYVGVIFGNRPLTGEHGFSPTQVGTPQLAGVRFFGSTANAHAGHSIASAGDFNRDGYGDLLISSPGELRNVNVGDTNGDGLDEIETRLGVAYLIFGGHHLMNHSFNLSQVGSPQLPGIVFVSRYVLGSQNEAPLETVGLAGDVDGDGFDDILLGAPTADFIDLASPDQRREDAGEVFLIYGNNFGSNRFDPSHINP